MDFKGFSTNNGTKSTVLKNIELIKNDLRNHFYTKRGERVMMPNYGSIIWDLLFEPYNDEIQNMIVDDVKTIVRSDSRVSLQSINIETSNHAITVLVRLYYIPYKTVGSFELEFDRRLG